MIRLPTSNNGHAQFSIGGYRNGAETIGCAATPVRREAIGLALLARIAPEGRGSANESFAEVAEEGARAYSALGRLEPHEQFIINLRVVERLSYREIEALTSWTREAARKAFERAIEKLRALYHSDLKP